MSSDIDKSEDAVYKVLKGISKEEAEAIYESIYYNLVDELGAVNGVPISLLRERADFKLRPYGWTYDKLFPWRHDAILS